MLLIWQMKQSVNISVDKNEHVQACNPRIPDKNKSCAEEIHENPAESLWWKTEF